MRPPPRAWIFDAGRQRTKVVALTVFSATCAVGAVAGAWAIWLTFGLSLADGGVLRPWPQRAAMASSVALLGISFLGAMILYGRHYVSRIAALDDDSVELSTVFSRDAVVVRRVDVERAAAHAGRFTGRQTVNAPWTSVRVRGRRLPLIIDDQGCWAEGSRPTWLM